MSDKKIKSFLDLDVWKTSHKLVVDIYIACEEMPRYDSLRSQIERSSLSITSNIAEGFSRQSFKDKQHFYVMARGSAYEVQSQLLVARDTKRLTKERLKALAELSLNSLFFAFITRPNSFITKGARC